MSDRTDADILRQELQDEMDYAADLEEADDTDEDICDHEDPRYDHWTYCDTNECLVRQDALAAMVGGYYE